MLTELSHSGQNSEIWRGAGPNNVGLAFRLPRAALSPSDAPEMRDHISAAFRAEARALASLTHRSIVRLQGHGDTSDGRPFVAFEWLGGQTFSQVLGQRGAGLPPRDAIRVLMPVALGLVLAHDRGFVHGDVRAEHIVLVPLDGATILPKLIDFRAARQVAPSVPPPSIEQPSRPVIRDVAGGDPLVDVRGFAATMFHAIAGFPPFATHQSAPPLPRTGLSQRDLKLWRILAEALAPVKSSHFPTMFHLTRQLAEWANLRGIERDITGMPVFARWLDPRRTASAPPESPHRAL